MEEIAKYPPYMIQILNKTNGAYATTQLGDDKYYQFRVVKLGIEYINQELGTDWLQKHYPYWDAGLMRRLLVLEKIVNQIKITYDRIRDRKMENPKKEVREKTEYFKALSRMPLFDTDLNRLYVFLISNTNLKRQVMKSEDFRELELSNSRGTELDKQKSKNI